MWTEPETSFREAGKPGGESNQPNIPGRRTFSPQVGSWFCMHSFFNLMPRKQNYPTQNLGGTGRASRVAQALRNSREGKMSCAYQMLTVDCHCATTVTVYMWELLEPSKQSGWKGDSSPGELVSQLKHYNIKEIHQFEFTSWVVLPQGQKSLLPRSTS